MANIMTLRKGAKDAISLVGEKAVSLGILSQKFSVPQAFIITADAFRGFMEATGIKKRMMPLFKEYEPFLGDEEKRNKLSQTIRKIIFHAPFPEEIREEIQDAYDALNIEEGHSLQQLMETGEEPVVVIRPSPIGYRGSGMHKTLFGVKGTKQLEEGVLECWTSFYSPEAIEWRIQNPNTAMDFAVIIQKMIDSQAAGNIHTSYKMNAEEVLIFGCKGIGNILSSGLFVPDRYFITKKSLSIASIEIGKQSFMFERDFDTGTIERVYMQEEYGKKQKISDKYIGELTLMSREIETLFGAPQEIAFALFKDHLYFLGAKEAEWHEEKKEKEEKKSEPLLPKEPTAEEVQKKEEEISASLTEELQKDVLVEAVLNGSANRTAPQTFQSEMQRIQEKKEVSSSLTEASSLHEINNVISTINFEQLLVEAETVQQSQRPSAESQEQLQKKQVSTIFPKKQTAVVLTETVADNVPENVSIHNVSGNSLGDISEEQKTEMTAMEKAAGEMVLHCFREVKALLSQEQWGTSPELRHLAVLSQNYSLKKIPPTLDQVKFALNAVERVKK